VPLEGDPPLRTEEKSSFVQTFFGVVTGAAGFAGAPEGCCFSEAGASEDCAKVVAIVTGEHEKNTETKESANMSPSAVLR
jgi:hypothetical protein